MKHDKVLVACPKCGHKQPEPRLAFSTACKQCGQYFRVQEVLHPAAKVEEIRRNCKEVSCFKCGTELEVALTAQSTMCKRCSSHVDLRDYRITNSVSKNFKTKGSFVVEEGGFLFNTETVAGEVILKGRLLGKLTAERSLEIHATAEIKGSFTTAHLIIPAGGRFRWPDTIPLVGAEISGECVANLQVAGTVVLRSAARLFGDVEAGNLVVESGAVMVGAARIGRG